jgi:UDP-N-acetylmuramoyl-L-alanyl-D-glutamate--2,6-diaminopimelate ligase
VIVDRAEAIAYAIDQAKETDILLLTGKGHETYEIGGQKRLSFNERELVRACMRRRTKGEA